LTVGWGDDKKVKEKRAQSKMHNHEQELKRCARENAEGEQKKRTFQNTTQNLVISRYEKNETTPCGREYGDGRGIQGLPGGKSTPLHRPEENRK